MKKFYERLNNLIETNKMSKYRIAKILKLSQSTIANWCDGLNEPKVTQIIELANLFDVSADYLLGLSKDDTNTGIEDRYINEVINIMYNLPENMKEYVLQKAIQAKKEYEIMKRNFNLA